MGRGPAPGKLELREENVAAAPGSPRDGGEGLTNNPWSALLTRRMLAQGKEWSNAMQREFRKGKVELRPRESLSDDREKIPGLVPATLYKNFETLLLSPDNRELSEELDLRCLALPL